ncbi:MAG: type II and III secretion system protein family protein [Hyphomicrobiales bacterium]
MLNDFADTSFARRFLAPGWARASLMLASLATAAALAVGMEAALAVKAQATDLNVSAADNNDSRFVRMGLNKSVVVRLPAEARDVIVGNPGIVDAVVRSKNTAYLFARSVGQTNIFFFDANGQQILNLDLEVAADTTALKKLLQRALPGNQITVDSANSNIVLGGMARNPLEAKTAADLATQYANAGAATGVTIINTMRVAGEDQVMLKVKIVEVQREVLKQFGIDVQALIKAGNFAFNLSSINPFANPSLSPTGGYSAAATGGFGSVDSTLKAMESDGLLRTLAEPNLTALSGADAHFLAGGSFPYCKDYDRTTKSCLTYEFKDYGVSLDFTPTVLDQGRINLKIKTEMSEFAAATTDVTTPVLNKRNAETSLELQSGGSMMLGGLIQDSTRQTIKGTPGLKQLPVLGGLFRSRDYVNNQTELVVMVTPYLVRPTGEKQLTTPDEGYNTATDRQTLFLGRLNKVYGGAGSTPQGTYHGNVGFIVE